MIRELGTAFGVCRRSWTLFLKYLIVTQVVLWLILYPSFWWVARRLFEQGGIISLHNANAASFLSSWPGAAFMGLGSIVLLITVLLEAGGFTKLSAVALRGGPEPPYRVILVDIGRSLVRITGPGILVVIFLALVVFPLTGSVMNAGFLSTLRVPNFVMSVIQANPIYHAAYWVLLVVLYLGVFAMSFLFQFMVLATMKVGAAAKASFTLIRLNALRFLLFMALGQVVFAAMMALVGALGAGAGMGLHLIFPDESWIKTFVGAVFLLIAAAGVTVLLSLYVPMMIFLATTRYYAYLEALPDDHPLRRYSTCYPRLKGKTKPSLLDRILRHWGALVAVFIAVIFAIAAGFTVAAKPLTAAPDIAVVGHRGGPGGVAIENTLEAIELSIADGAAYVEVDLQRTKDGQYVTFHDTTFSRFTSENRRVQELTLAEIQALDLGQKSGGVRARVPSLAELLEATRGRIGLFLELKGPSADPQMVDDAVAALREANMLDQTVMMSLDYQLIEYIEASHPEVVSGFTYVMSFGRTAQLAGDYLILEEDAASWDVLADIHEAGKRAAVWTINTEESMERVANWPVDAVITDYVARWNRVAEVRRQAEPLEVLVNFLLS